MSSRSRLFALAWSRIGMAVAGVLTVLLALTQLPAFLGTASAADGSTPLVVMTLNMHYGGADAGDIVDTVRERDVDVLALVELTPDAVARPRRPRSRRPAAAHRAVATRDRIRERAVEPLPTHPGRRPRGLRAPTGGGDARARRPGGVRRGGAPVAPYPDGARRWSREMADLADWLGAVDGAAIVAGDFNATRDHQQFRSVLDAGFEDAGAQAGSGWQPTFPANRRRIPMLITIDHVLVSDGIVATDLDRIEIPGTDHATLVATLAVAPGLADDGG